MRTDTPVTVYRKDYQPYPYDIPQVSLAFDLAPDSTEVRCIMQVRRKADASADAALVLDGEELELVSVGVDGQALPADRYHLSEHSLALYGLPAEATVEIVSRCKPSANSTLMGLYVSGGNFFTQCEAEGFRRITCFADRPDVMALYTVTLRADKAGLPGAAVQRQPGRLAPVARRPQRGGMGRPVPQALLSVRAGGRQPDPPRNHGQDRQWPRRAAAGLQRPGRRDQDRMGAGFPGARAALGRNPFRPGARPGPLHDRRGQRLQHGRDGEQGPQHLQLQLRAGPRRNRHRRRPPAHRIGRRRTSTSTTGPATASPAATGSSCASRKASPSSATRSSAPT